MAGPHSLAVALLALSIAHCSAFSEGEFIPSSRRSQYHEVRTQWHDLLGTHCPKFGHDRIVALPLPKPHVPMDKGTDTYKIQLSFDGDRLVTQWLKVMGKGAPVVPVLMVQLRKAGDELLGVTAKVEPAPVPYLHMHAQLVEEFKNESHWPKHLLIHYRFKTEHEVDLDRGLYVLMAIGLVALLILVFNAASGAEAKLAQFMQDMTSDNGVVSASGVVVGGSAAGPSIWKGQGKAE